MNQHILTGQVDVTSNLLVGSSHLFVDTTNNRVGLVTNDPHAGLHVNSNAYVNTDLRVGSQIEINETVGRIKAASFEGDGSLLVNAPVGSLAVHSTDTGLPGTNAIVTNEGTPTAAEFKFVIPRGDVGATGTAATIATGTTTTGAAGTSASVTNSGSSSAAVFDFTVPRGDQGIQGIQGIQGETGTAATVAVGTTTTGTPGTNASVTNTGSSSAASFDFTIPRGDTGATGPAGTVAIGTTTTGAAGSSASVTNTGTSTAANLEFTVPKGDQGIQGVQGPAATVAVGTTTTGAAGTNGSVTNSGSSSAAVFDFTVPRGADGADGTNYFTLSGSDIYRSTGNVGIGTTDPSTRLHVETATGVSTNLVKIGSSLNSGSSQSVSGIEFAANPAFFNGDNAQRVPAQITSGFYQGGGADWEDAYISLRTPTNPSSGTINDVLTIRGGNVGIGTTSPSAKLEVHNSGAAASIADLVADFTGSWIRIGDARSSRTFSGGSGIKFHDSGVAHYSVGQLDGKFKISVSSGDGNSLFPSGYNEGITLNTSGNVGIGTTDPDVKFQVEGTSTSHQKLTKFATYNIFHHRDDGGYEHLITYGGSDGQAYFNNRDNFMYVQIPSIGGETLYTSTVTGFNSGYFNARFRDLNGNKPNLGQNTTYKVHVYSSRIDASGTITTTGNVGIGTTSPGYKLDVAGNLRVTTGILDTSWCSGSWLQTCTQSPTVTVYSNNGGGPMSTPGHGGTGMGGNRGRFTAKKAGNYLISCCAVHMGRGTTTSSGTNLLVTFQASGTNWNPNNVINTYDEIIDLRTAPTAEEAYTFACQVYMNVGHYFSFQVHSSGYIDNNAKLLCSAALVR